MHALTRALIIVTQEDFEISGVKSESFQRLGVQYDGWVEDDERRKVEKMNVAAHPAGFYEGDGGNELQVSVNLILIISELGHIYPAHSHQVQVALVPAALHKDDSFAQSLLQKLQRLSTLRPPLEVCQVELLQQTTDELQMLCKLPAILFVHASIVGSFDDHGYQLDCIHSCQLPHICYVPHCHP